MLYYIVAFFQVVFCIALVGLILLHSGKGGGLSSSLGGGMGGTFSGTTIMEKNLTRLDPDRRRTLLADQHHPVLHGIKHFSPPTGGAKAPC